MIPILKAAALSRAEILQREDPVQTAEETVASIIAAVRRDGDAALLRYTQEFDGATLEKVEVTPEQVDWGFRQADPQLVEILYMAAERIIAFHEKQKRSGYLINDEPGVLLGQKVLPLARVGIYVPGGTAAYPSSVLMNALPAKIAGVSEIVMVTPPGKHGVSPNLLAAAKIAGVDRVFAVGGAQAVAALAYGTESVPQVDKIVGPGNRFVAEAKRQVFGRVDIDMIAGPSEILIVADAASNPRHVAADLLSQAEHDEHASAILITDSAPLAEAVQEALEALIPTMPRREIARTSIDKNGKILLVDNLREAIDLSNALAPEHLELCIEQPFDYLDAIQNAGSVFLGRHCPEALGDYFAGPNHTLPTGGTARFSSPLSVDDFVKTMQYSYFSRDALKKVSTSVAYFAAKEGLYGHGESVTIRFEENDT